MVQMDWAMEREGDASCVFVSSYYQILAMPVLAQPAQGLQFSQVKIGDL